MTWMEICDLFHSLEVKSCILTDHQLSPSPDKKKKNPVIRIILFFSLYASFPIFYQDLEKRWWKYNIYLDLIESGILLKKKKKSEKKQS